MKQEQLKVRKSKLSEDEILQIAEVLKDKYCSFAEIKRMARHYGMRGGIESILSLFNVRGYLVTEETLKIYDVHCKRFMKKTVYKILTDEDYKKYEEETLKDAKRRLLAAVSY